MSETPVRREDVATRSARRLRASSSPRMASATSSGILPPVSMTASASLGVQWRTTLEHLDDLVEGPGRRQGGPLGQAAAVGFQPAGQLGGIGRQPDDEPELAEPSAIGLAEHGPAAGGEDRRRDSPPSTRPASAPPSRGTPARPTRRRSTRIERPARASISRSAVAGRAGPAGRPGSARPSTCPCLGSRSAPGPDRGRHGGVRVAYHSSRRGQSLRWRTSTHHVHRGVLPGVELELERRLPEEHVHAGDRLAARAPGPA